MIVNLPKWYKITSIDNVNAEVLENRSKSINSICDSQQVQWFLDCIRIYLNKPLRNKDFYESFIQMFRNNDPMFPDSGNELECRVLAGATLGECIGRKSTHSLTIALALKSAAFGILESDIINIDILKSADKLVELEAIEIRKYKEDDEQKKVSELSVNEELSTFEDVSTSLKEVVNYLKSNVKSLQHRIDVLEEETNIHWWIFRESSTSQNKPISELPQNAAPFIVARELYYLATLTPGPHNARQLFLKAFSYVSGLIDLTVSLRDGIGELIKTDSELLEDKEGTKFGDITPLFFAYSKAKETDGEPGWEIAFEKATKLDSSFRFSSIDLAEQFFLESIFVYYC